MFQNMNENTEMLSSIQRCYINMQEGYTEIHKKRWEILEASI